MLVLDVKVGDALTIKGVGKVTVGSKSGQQVRLVIDVDKQYAASIEKAKQTEALVRR